MESDRFLIPNQYVLYVFYGHLIVIPSPPVALYIHDVMTKSKDNVFDVFPSFIFSDTGFECGECGLRKFRSLGSSYQFTKSSIYCWEHVLQVSGIADSKIQNILSSRRLIRNANFQF